MPNKKKNIVLSIIGTTLILIMLLGATYAYFQAQIKNGASSNIAIDADTVDVLTFKASNDISFDITQENFKEGAGNKSGTTILNAHLIANNTNQTASYKYNVYLDITKNNFVYSKDSNTPEIVLVIKNPKGQYVTTRNDKIGNTTNVDLNDEQVPGYDITTKIGLIEISLDYIIYASPSTKGERDQNWEISVVFVNLDSNQVANAGKSFKAKAKVQSEKINVLDLGGTEYAYYRGTDSYDSKSGYRNQIKNVYFVNYIAPEEELNSVASDANWDLSSLKDKSIMGWLKNENEDTTAPYNLYIGSNLKEGEKIVVRSFAYDFYRMQNLETVDLNPSILDTSNLNDISYMFRNTSKLTTIIGIEDLDVSNVIDMSYMFYYDYSLTSLDLSQWSTSQVKYMTSMFESTSGLTELDLSNWNIKNVTNMSHMFLDTTNLKNIKGIEDLDVSNVTNMSYMFCGTGLSELDISKWDTHNVTDMSYIFAGNDGSNIKTNLFSIKGLEDLDVSNVTNMSGMFYMNDNLVTIDISKWDTHNVTDMSRMFQGRVSGVVGDGSFVYTKLTTIIGIEDLDVSNVTNMSGMFAYDIKLTKLDLSNWDTSKVTDMSHMFQAGANLYYESKLATLNISKWNTSSVTNMSYMFSHTSALTSLDLSEWDTHNVTNMSYMFERNKRLIELNLSGWDTHNVMNMESMFSEASSLTSIDMRKATFSQVTNYNNMFYDTNSSLKVTITGDANKSWFIDHVLPESKLDVLKD